MTTDELKAKITKLDNKQWGTIAPSQEAAVKGYHNLERATYELALQIARVGDLIETVLPLLRPPEPKRRTEAKK